jgi:hypothetical protein
MRQTCGCVLRNITSIFSTLHYTIVQYFRYNCRCTQRDFALSFSSYTKLLNLENVSVPYDIDFMEGFAIRKVKEYFLNIIMPSNCKRKIFHVKCMCDHFPSLTKITKLSSCDACKKEAGFTRA